MRILIKFTQPTLFALLLIGVAQCVHAAEPPPQKDTSHISGLASWHDGSKGGAYGIGEGWSIEIIPAVYETLTEVIIVHGMTPLILLPAEYEWVRDTGQDFSDQPETLTELVTIPAEYETITEIIVSEPARTEYYLTEPVYMLDGTVITPAAVKAQNIPAVTKEEPRRVVRTAERTETRTIPNSPLERINGNVRVVKTPVRVVEGETLNPPETITRKAVKLPARFVVKRADGEITHVFDKFEDLTAFVDSLK